MRGLYRLLPLALVFWSASSEARIEQTLNYTKQQSYHAALRYLRIDSGFNITEKDLDSGYLLFEYPIRGTTEVTTGSVEIIERDDSVALVVQLPQMPKYHERMLATGLLKKLRTDYGDPPRAKTPADKAPPKPERDADKAKDEAAPAAPDTPPKKKK